MSIDETSPVMLDGRRVVFVGKLGGVTRREAQQLVRQHGALAVEGPPAAADLIVVGADELPLGGEEGELLDDATREAAAEGRLEIISETQLWQQLGMVDVDTGVRRLYTPAMLAELLNVPVSTIRAWHRRGLIVPAREVHRLPYFDFQEVATARHIAQLVAAGASPAAIEKKLEELAKFVPDVERPLAQLSVIVEGQQILLRQGEGLLEPGGQLRIDFDALENRTSGNLDLEPSAPILRFEILQAREQPPDPEEILQIAARLEEEGALRLAAEACRAALAAGSRRPDVTFQLAELLYRMGDLTAARERYYAAIELDEDYVEARANLGCVLAELGDLELAIAAFEGALRYHRDFPDVHYHLAKTLDEAGRSDEADEHWREFLNLAPESPWADEARERLAFWDR